MTFLYTTLKAILCLLALVWNYLVKALRFLAGSSASSRDSEPGRISLGDDDDGSTLPLAISSSLSPSPSPSPAPTPLFTPLLLSFSPPTTRTIVASPRLFEIYQANRFSGGSLDHLALHGPPKLANRDSLHVDTEQTKRPSVLIPRTARRPQTQSIETSRSSDAPSTRKYSRHCGQVFDFGFDPFDPANAHLDFSPGSSIISMTPPTPSILSSSPLAGPPMKRESRPLSSSQGKGLAIELNEDTNAHIFDNVVAEEDTKDRATSEGPGMNPAMKPFPLF
ncbi:hypothetical protein BDN72DRAFT_211120 [Pluteus cervinus]|uniref:Uncharacterized protein n=1 Tax=Pluteus cervinus TaxID=181527 RepID=A0ACD3B6A6_9AGAR|nr:hypothetical protein BDN72DRAFT_211120 [Pluteus cervinus]